MVKWEYLVVNIVNGGAVIPDPYRFNDGDVQSYITQVVCNRLGEYGWELSGIASTDSSHYKLFFKRQKH